MHRFAAVRSSATGLLVSLLAHVRTCSSGADRRNDQKFDISGLPETLQQEFDFHGNAMLLRDLLGRKLNQREMSTQAASPAPYPILPTSRLVVRWKCGKCDHVWSSRVFERAHSAGKPGCPACTAVSSDGPTRSEEVSKKLLVMQYPSIAADWEGVRNALPENNVPYKSVAQVPIDSPISVWWLCQVCDTPWKEPIDKRVESFERKKRRLNTAVVESCCPRCDERRLPRHLARQRRYLADHELLLGEAKLAKDQDPTEIMLESSTTLRWVCSACQFEFSMPINDRSVRGARCPCCSGQQPTALNLVTHQRPDVLQEVAKNIPRSVVLKLTTSSSRLVPFVCRRCLLPFIMTVKERCLIPPGVVACPKCRHARESALTERFTSASGHVPKAMETMELPKQPHRKTRSSWTLARDRLTRLDKSLRN